MRYTMKLTKKDFIIFKKSVRDQIGKRIKEVEEAKMKPSERISEMLLYQDKDYLPKTEQEARLFDYVVQIMDYLDEEAKWDDERAEAEKDRYLEICKRLEKLEKEVLNGQKTDNP